MKISFGSLSPRQQMLAPYLALAAAVFLAYSNTLNNPFLFDDGLLVTRNELLRSWETFGQLFTASTTEGAHIKGGFFRPLQNILYFFVYQIFGEEPVGFHLLNTALHATNAGLVYLLGKKLGFNPIACFFASLIWAVHPIHTEAITYISGTADPLYSFFCASSIFCPISRSGKYSLSCRYSSWPLSVRKRLLSFRCL